MKNNTVYFSPFTGSDTLESNCEKIKALFRKNGFNKLIKKDDFVALKMHLGEEKKSASISSAYVKTVADLVKEAGGRPFVTDTNTMYEGKRSNAVEHLALAAKNGLSLEQLGCPVIIADGLIGENQISVPCSAGYVHISGLAKRVDVIIALTHCTGHLLTGYGGAIKNIAMGFASRGGKLDMHSGVKPDVIIENCAGCGICFNFCPAGSITIKNKKASIKKAECFGCGECFAICPNKAIKVDKWTASSDVMQRKMALYCTEILRDKKAGFINFALNVTKNCDCLNKIEKPLTDDVGIFSSLDVVAVDAASVNVINSKTGQDIFKQAWTEIDYNIQFNQAEKLGAGTRKYELITLG